MKKKHVFLVSIASALITATSIILLTPQNGDDLIEEMEYEKDVIKNKLHTK